MNRQFSQGLLATLDNATNKSGNDKISNEEKEKFKDMFLRIEDGVTYTVYLLDSPDKWIFFNEHNYVPVTFVKKDGSTIPGNKSFFCVKDFEEECELCKQGARSRKVLALGVYIQSKKFKSKKNGKETIEPVEEKKIIIIPPGKNNANWIPLKAQYENKGTVQDRFFFITRTGSGLDTLWTITQGDKEDFPASEFSDVETLDIGEAISNSGKWLHTEDLSKNLVLNIPNKSEDGNQIKTGTIADDL